MIIFTDRYKSKEARLLYFCDLTSVLSLFWGKNGGGQSSSTVVEKPY
jgi:hypothetical protein